MPYYDVEAAPAPWDDAGNLKQFLRGVLGRERPAGASLGFTIDGSARDDGRYRILDTRAPASPLNRVRPGIDR